MFTMMSPRQNRRAALLAAEVLLLGLLAVMAVGFGTAQAAPELTGSRVITLERSDDGELYAALSVILDLAVTQAVDVVIIHDQAATWQPGFGSIDRRTEWDASVAWRPTPGWSVSLGRRWRVGPPSDYEGPWTYVQVWRGF